MFTIPSILALSFAAGAWTDTIAGEIIATLQWDHAVQFANQPEAVIQIFTDQQLRAVAGG